MRKLLLATRNQGKLRELQELILPLGIQVIGLNDIPPIPETIEDSDTFKANAIKKALETHKHTGYISLADDSGLVVDALNGLPGIHSARFAGDKASDADNNKKLLDLLAHVEASQRTARFVCVIALCSENGQVVTVEGQCEGSIDFKLRGVEGFGYDPLFIPEGYELSFAEISNQEKNAISHRGKALKLAIPLIKKFVLGE